MPDPPSIGLVTRFLLENPYPVGLVVLAVAGGLLWTGLREGRRERMLVGPRPPEWTRPPGAQGQMPRRA